MDDDPNLINPIDFQTIKDSEYMNFVELREDFAWFVHNCLVKYPSGNSKTKKDIPKAANKLLQGLEQEIQNLKLCSECYENAYKNPDNSFMMPCKTPHILLWVDCVQYGFWPAKLMKYDGENMVSVRFFGDHTNACVLSSECYIFSEVIPKNKYVRDGTHSASFALALNVSSC